MSKQFDGSSNFEIQRWKPKTSFSFWGDFFFLFFFVETTFSFSKGKEGGNNHKVCINITWAPQSAVFREIEQGGAIKAYKAIKAMKKTALFPPC